MYVLNLDYSEMSKWFNNFSYYHWHFVASVIIFFLKKQIKLLHYRGEKKEIHPIQTLGREIQLIRWTD